MSVRNDKKRVHAQIQQMRAQERIPKWIKNFTGSGSGLRMASKQRIGSKDSQARVKLAQFEVVMVT